MRFGGDSFFNLLTPRINFFSPRMKSKRWILSTQEEIYSMSKEI